MVSRLNCICKKKSEHESQREHFRNKYIILVGNRKSTDESNASPAMKRRRAAADDDSDISFNYSNISCNSTLNTSNQWEVRILKADLIEANTKVI